jgi:hypothetical protein
MRFKAEFWEFAAMYFGKDLTSRKNLPPPFFPSERLVRVFHTTRCHNPYDSNLLKVYLLEIRITHISKTSGFSVPSPLPQPGPAREMWVPRPVS